MIGAVAAGAATGQVSAAEGEAVVEATKYFGMTMFGWIASVLTLIFAGMTLLFKDFRVAILTLIMFGVTAAITYLGI